MKYTLINPMDSNLSPIEQILVNRGIKREDIPHYLSPTEKDNLSCLLLNNIDRGIEMLFRHLNNKNDSIVCIVD